MLNKLTAFLREEDMIAPGDTVIAAVSGGADSVALLFALYLLKEKLGISLEAAHFDHQLRGEESRQDAAFVAQLCDRFDIPLHMGTAQVIPGRTGLEAAAREARYGFFRTLDGKVATAHTADDNAETVLLHLLRGTGLKGLGGIAPKNGRIIRPMLKCTRQDVEAFLTEYCLQNRFDGSNATDDFLRNRLRHHVMPLLKQENPRFAPSVSAMALRLRQDEDLIQSLLPRELPGVEELKNIHPALRGRLLERFLKEGGIPEPEQTHIRALEKLIFSGKPSAAADLPGGFTALRRYDRLELLQERPEPVGGLLEDRLELPELGLAVTCAPATELVSGPDTFTVCPRGPIRVRFRETGDTVRLPGGTKSLKKLFIDRKIPAHDRDRVPVLADEEGILAVHGIGPNEDRKAAALPAVTIRIRPLDS